MKSYIAMVVLALGIQWGCAGHKDVISRIEGEQPIASETPNPELTPTEGQIPTTEHYTVIPKDSLWKIAGNVYQDAFQWPAIFKANRDQIQDPDLIYPKQIFVIDRGQNPAKMRALSLKTPRYHRHFKPRKTLPVDYF